MIQNPIIISCAVTGAIHTPSMSPYLPITSEEIIQDALEAAKAGASILHLHARDPEDGHPVQTPEAFLNFLPPIKNSTSAVLNLTTGGSPHMTIEERVKPAIQLKPELASLNMGSINFGLYPLLDKYKEFKCNWESAHLRNTEDLVFRNSFKDIGFILNSCKDQGTRFEFECYDVGHLYNLAHFLDRKLIEPPLFIQTIFGILGGIGSHNEDLAYMKRTADRLFGNDFIWSVLGAGSAQLRMATQGIVLGGNLRVGLEDSLWAGKGKLAKSSAEQILMVRKVIEGLGGEIASPTQTRQLLCLKGAENTNF